MTILRLPPPNIAISPPMFDRWFQTLTPPERSLYMAYITNLVNRQPATVQTRIRTAMVRQQASTVQQPGLGYVGFIIGAAAGVTSGLMQAGVSIYTGREQADLQRELAGMSANTQIMGQAIDSITQRDIASLMADVQKEAAQLAASSQVQSTQTMAQAQVAQTQIMAEADVIKAQTTGAAAVVSNFKTPLLVGGGLAALLAAWAVMK